MSSDMMNSDCRPSYRQHPQYPSDIATTKTPWTSARCNRLLRPLSSKIALLRKEGQFEPDFDVARYATDIATVPSGNVGSVGCHRNSAQAAADADAEWQSDPRPRKKIKRTYSAKDKTLSMRDTDDNAVEARACLSTSEAVIGVPFQLTFEVRSSETSRTIEGNDSCPRPLPAQYLRVANPSPEFPKDLAPNNWKLINGIGKGLVALLKATHCGKSPLTSGCRSLFSTCLRQIPNYIAEEEHVADADDQDVDIDISSAVYSDLEEFGSMPGGGWEPLREVARAHSISMVIDAIEDGILGLPVTRHLFYLCLDVCAFDEAQRIIESLTRLATPTDQLLSKKARQLSHDLHEIVNSLGSLASRSGSNGFLYRHTAAMLDRCILPTSWISSKSMVGTWNKAIQSIAQEDENAQSAAILLHTAVAMSYRKADATPLLDVHDIRLDLHVASHRPVLRSGSSGQISESNVHLQRSSTISGNSLSEETNGGVRSTVSNLLTVLSAIMCLRVPGGPLHSDACNTWITTLLNDLSLGALRAIDTMTQDPIPNHLLKLHVDSLRLPLLAAGLAEVSSSGCSSHVSQPRFPWLSNWTSFSSSTEDSSFAGSFICAVARCCGRARSEDPFEVVQAIVQDLIKASKLICYDEQTRKICSDLALAAAFAYSEDTSRPSHLDWALQVELDLTGKAANTPKPALARTPARSIRQSKSGYRWEEGICEWIAMTPDLLMHKLSDVRSAIDGMGEPVDHMEQASKGRLPLSSEMSPCAASKKPAKARARSRHDESKALHVLIQPKLNRCSRSSRSKKLGSINSCQHSEKSFPLKSFSRIYEDNDVDELSTPGSSQVDTLALSTLQELSNSVLGVKRRRWFGHKLMHASETSISTSSRVQFSQIAEQHHGLDMAEDELAVLFK